MTRLRLVLCLLGAALAACASPTEPVGVRCTLIQTPDGDLKDRCM